MGPLLFCYFVILLFCYFHIYEFTTMVWETGVSGIVPAFWACFPLFIVSGGGKWVFKASSLRA
jgi:hypothetical protein